MSKNNMKLKYKAKKRERNKNKEVYNKKDEVTSGVKTIIGVILFVLVFYACAIGLDSLGVFDKSYEAPTKEETEFDYNFILVGSVFNRSEKTYYVLFDDFNEYSENAYVKYLSDKTSDVRIYKVDMSLSENKSHMGSETNKKASNPSDLVISDVTLIKIKNGKIVDYIESNDKVSSYLSEIING